MNTCMQYAKPGSLKAASTVDNHARDLIEITGRLPWGEYQVWVDPSRDFNMVKFLADLEESQHGPGRILYHIEPVDLVRVENTWVPATATMLMSFEADPTKLMRNTGQTTWAALLEFSFIDYRLLVDRAAPEDFTFEWPVVTRVRDSIVGYTYTFLRRVWNSTRWSRCFSKSRL